MAIALASGAADVHRQRRPSLHTHAPPPDAAGGGSGTLSIGVFSVNELLWTCRPTDPTTLQHQKGCRLFEQQERMFFARPGREIIRAGYRPEDAVDTPKQGPPLPPPPSPHHALAMAMAQTQDARLQAQAQAQAQMQAQQMQLMPLSISPQTQHHAQAQGQAMQAQMSAPPAGPLTTHHFVLEHDRERARPSPRRGAGRRGGGGGSGAATPRRRRRTGESVRSGQAEFEAYGGTGLEDESNALGMIVDGHGVTGASPALRAHPRGTTEDTDGPFPAALADPRHRDREREEAMQMAMGEHTPRTRQPARSRRNSSAQGPLSPAERGGRAEAGVLVFGEPSPFVASGR